jgi:hypothetical protein
VSVGGNSSAPQFAWWIDSGHDLEAATRARLLPFIVIVVVLVFFFLVIGLSTGAQRAFVAVALLEAVLFGGMIVVLIFTTYSRMTRAVGIAPHGVIVRRNAGDLQFGWNQLQPGLNLLPQNVFWFQTLASGRQGSSGGLGGFSVSLNQARAIVLSPFAPPWVLSPKVANALGVPTQRTVAPIPTLPGPAAPLAESSVPVPRVAPNLVAAKSQAQVSPPAYSAPAPHPGVISSAGASRPARPSGPPPGFVPCPQCGQLNRAGGTAFCVTCGHRLPRAF